MGIDPVFDDIVKTCEFYSDDDHPVEVDEENYYIRLGDYAVGPVVREGRFVSYIVEDPDGVCLFVSDLDDYFQERLPGWEDWS